MQPIPHIQTPMETETHIIQLCISVHAVELQMSWSAVGDEGFGPGITQQAHRYGVGRTVSPKMCSRKPTDGMSDVEVAGDQLQDCTDSKLSLIHISEPTRR